MAMNRAFEPTVMNKFKGMNTALVGSTPEAVALGENDLADITNFNTNTDGFLEKRTGVSELCRITSPGVPNNVRVVYLQRTRVGTPSSRLFVTDGSNTWRIDAITGAITRLTISSGTALANLQSMAEFGGSAPSTAYNCSGVRWVTTSSPRSVGGIAGFYNDGTVDQSGWVSDSPIGTFITIFKNRGWVINSRGGENSLGDETKVWFSDPLSLTAWGGAGLPNNFNLDFGDGDFLTSMIPYNNQMYFFKTKKMYVTSAEGAPTNWSYRLVSDRLGCIGRGTVKLYNGVLYFLSLEGVVRTDGTTFQIISAPVREFFDVYRNFINPQVCMDLFASIWDNKYIIWEPNTSGQNTQTALVFNLHTETWTKWVFSNTVSANGESVLDEHYPDTLYFGSALGSSNTNRVWQMPLSQVWTDNGGNYTCSFTTRKHSFGKVMSRKRNHLVGVTVADNSNNQGTYTVTTTSDDTTAATLTQAPARLSAMNVKARGAGYGRYFQTKVDQLSSAYAAVYDVTWMIENRGFDQKSIPVRNS